VPPSNVAKTQVDLATRRPTGLDVRIVLGNKTDDGVVFVDLRSQPALCYVAIFIRIIS
jgi:hypothetical protein